MGQVTYIVWPGEKQQWAAYHNALQIARLDTKWLGFIDTDEFIVPVEKEKILDVIEEINPKWGLAISWGTIWLFLHRT